MKTLLLLHGALGAAAQLEPLKKILQGEYDVHVIEFEGHGQTKSDKPFSIDLFVSNLQEYLEKNSLRNVLVFGYSMGGYVALKLASQQPDYFSKIITLGTKFEWTAESAEREIKMLNPEKIEEKVPAFAQMLHDLHPVNGWKNVMHKTAAMMLRLGNGEATTDAQFSQIKTKCVLSVGDLDQMVTQQETMRIAMLIPQSEFYVMKNTVHPIDKVDMISLANYIKTKTA